MRFYDPKFRRVRLSIYVGYHTAKEQYDIVRCSDRPTEAMLGAYSPFIGPFKTLRAAQFMASPAARNNPHCRCVADAERITKRERT